MDLNEAAVFVKVVQAGSFSAAARQLGLPTSTVSTRITRLEKRLGVALLQRTTRRLNLTEAGSLFYEHSSIGLDHMLDAESAVTAAIGEPKGILRVTAPPDFGDELLASIIHNVRQEHPLIDIELMLDDRYVDLIAEGVDIAIRTGKLHDSSYIAKQVGVACWAAFASPEYLNNTSPLTKPQHLYNHICLQFTSLGKDQWVFFNNEHTITIPMDRKIVINDYAVIKAMVLSSEGVALLPIYACRDDISTGKLVRVLPEWYAIADPVYLFFPGQRFIPSKLRVFIDIATLELKRWLDQSNSITF